MSSSPMWNKSPSCISRGSWDTVLDGTVSLGRARVDSLMGNPLEAIISSWYFLDMEETFNH